VVPISVFIDEIALLIAFLTKTSLCSLMSCISDYDDDDDDDDDGDVTKQI